MQSFHTVIIGGGPGCTGAAKVLARAKKPVAVISDDLGGECLNYGCIPTKTYLWTAEFLEKLGDADAFGIEGVTPRANWEKMKKRKNEVVAKLKKNLIWTLDKLGVKVISGRASFKDKNTLEILAADGNKETVRAENIIIATGSEQIFPEVFKKTPNVIGSREILDLPEIPKNLLIIGGGSVGVEFASVFAALGTSVVIAERAARLLPNEDPEISAELQRVFARKNIEVRTAADIKPAELNNFEKVLVATGRKPVTENLKLENAGVLAGPSGIQTTELMQTNVSNIFAIGDVAGRALLAYTAEREGEIAARAILGEKSKPINYEIVLNTIFCLPEIASVGLTEEQAKERGIEYIAGKSA